MPVVGIAAIAKFGFDGGKSLQQKLESVGDGESVLAGDVSHDLVHKKFAERHVNGGGGLEIADSGEDVTGDEVAFCDAADFAEEMVMAEAVVAGIDGVGAAFAVGAEELATAVGSERDWWRRGVRGGDVAFAARNGVLRRA